MIGSIFLTQLMIELGWVHIEPNQSKNNKNHDKINVNCQPSFLDFFFSFFYLNLTLIEFPWFKI